MISQCNNNESESFMKGENIREDWFNLPSIPLYGDSEEKLHQLGKLISAPKPLKKFDLSKFCAEKASLKINIVKLFTLDSVSNFHKVIFHH